MSTAILLRSLFTAILLLSAAAPHAAEPVNRALGRPVTPLVDTVEGLPESVVDGDPATVWWSYQGQSSELDLLLDLGAPHAIDRLVLRAYQTETIEVLGSLDGVAWTPLYQTSIGYFTNPVIVADRAERTTARHLRYRAGNVQSGYVGLAELEVYDLTTVFVDGFEPTADVRR